MYNKRELSDEEVLHCAEIIKSTQGIQNSTGLAFLHMEKALDNLVQIKQHLQTQYNTEVSSQAETAFNRLKGIMLFILQRTN